MKPLKLTMQAFGSYVTPGTIDFERTEQNLFLITGDRMEMSCRASMQIRRFHLLWN